MADSISQKRISNLLRVAKKYGSSRAARGKLRAQPKESDQSAMDFISQYDKGGYLGDIQSDVELFKSGSAPWRRDQGGQLTVGQDVGGSIFEGYDESGNELYNASPLQISGRTRMPTTEQGWRDVNMKGNTRRSMSIDPNMPQYMKDMALSGSFDPNMLMTREAEDYARSIGIKERDFTSELQRIMGGHDYLFGKNLILPENMDEIDAASARGTYTGFEPTESDFDKEHRLRRERNFGPRG